MEFKRLVGVRNNLVHGKPASTPNGDQNLFNDKNWTPWTIPQINKAADEFAECGAALNQLMHSLLDTARL